MLASKASAAESWPQVFAHIDRLVADWSAASLAEAFIEHGCAVVRGAVDLGRLAELRHVADTTPWPGAHLYDPAGFDLLPPMGEQLLGALFAHRWARQYAAFRRIRPRGASTPEAGQKPLPIHVDAQFHQIELMVVNFWIPFDRCGRRAPGLKLVPKDIPTTLAHSGYTGEPVRDRAEYNFRFFPKEPFTDRAIRASFGEDCWLAPEMEPGDVIVLSNWILHGTHATPDMSDGRLDVELRFIGKRAVAPRPVDSV